MQSEKKKVSLKHRTLLVGEKQSNSYSTYKGKNMPILMQRELLN
jgi:hypothetical protein